MNDGKSKKELITQYKEREIVGGVYIIKNTLNNKILLKAGTNLQGSKNRFEFSQKTGSCIDMKLQGDWNKQGGKQFVFEVLEELKKGETQTAEEFKTDISALKEMWLDKLSDRDLY
ncbi:MAG: GIY-YIG nuclease family protein [Eubacteriales bacterium]|nr:GIY-YIG nuclease family protein [Eubacteriales bacterium]